MRREIPEPPKNSLNAVSSDDNNKTQSLWGKIQKSIKIKIRSPSNPITQK